MFKLTALLVVFVACTSQPEPPTPHGPAAPDVDVDVERWTPTCGALPDAVPVPQLTTEVVYLSEELAFDGRGALIAKKGEFLIAVPAHGASRYVSHDPALATLSLGLRYLADGDLAVAQPAVADGLVARILRVHPDGGVEDLFTAADMPAGLPPLIIPNALAADPAGGVFVTDSATSQVLHIGADRSVAALVVGPEAARAAGAAYDARQRVLYYTSGEVVRAIAVDAAGGPRGGSSVVATVPGGRLDGVVLDACGNLYVLDSDPAAGRFALYRVTPGAAPHRLAVFDDLVSGVQFGAGPGFDDHSVYVSSVAGKVFRVRVGVGGL